MRARVAVVTALAALLVASSAADAEDQRDFTVCLVPLGKHDKRAIKPILAGVTQLYGVKTKLLDARALPRAAYYKPRRRYRAEKLLRFIDKHVFPDSGCDRVIGLTAVDISTTKEPHEDWGIFGLAWIGGPSGVVSTFRLGRKANRRKRLIRAIKVFNHELGHALGSEHVTGVGCLMEDGAGTIKTVDRERGTLCPDTIKVIEKKTGLTLPRLESFDWNAAISP